MKGTRFTVGTLIGKERGYLAAYAGFGSGYRLIRITGASSSLNGAFSYHKEK